MLHSQDTGSDFAASALADGPETPKAPLTDASKEQTAQKSYFSRSTEPKQAPLPDLPVRQSHLSSTESQTTKKPVNFTSSSSFTNKQAGEAQAWVAHSDGRTNDIKAAPELKAAVPAKGEHNLSDRDAQYTGSKSPLAKDLAQAAKKGQPVAWVAHKDGRLDDIESAPVLAEALPAKVSNKLTGPAGKGRGGSGFFGKVQLQTALTNTLLHASSTGACLSKRASSMCICASCLACCCNQIAASMDLAPTWLCDKLLLCFKLIV